MSEEEAAIAAIYADQIVPRIFMDICNREGIGEELASIEESVEAEIIRKWRNIVCEELTNKPGVK